MPASCGRVASWWYEGHAGADADSGLVHTLVGTAANEADVTHAHELLHGEEQAVSADAGYQGADKREGVAARAPNANWHIAMWPGRCKRLPKDSRWAALTQQLEQLKARVRAKVEHPFHVVNNLFRHRKTRYKGLAKNTAQMFALFGQANLALAPRWLLTRRGKVRPEFGKMGYIRPQRGESGP